MVEVLRLLVGERSVHFKTGIRPRTDPLAIMKIRLDRRAVARVGFVITSAGAERPRPTRGAVRLVGDVMFLEESILARMIDAVEHGAELVLVGAGKPMA